MFNLNYVMLNDHRLITSNRAFNLNFKVLNILFLTKEAKIKEFILLTTFHAKVWNTDCPTAYWVMMQFRGADRIFEVTKLSAVEFNPSYFYVIWGLYIKLK